MLITCIMRAACAAEVIAICGENSRPCAKAARVLFRSARLIAWTDRRQWSRGDFFDLRGHAALHRLEFEFGPNQDVGDPAAVLIDRNTTTGKSPDRWGRAILEGHTYSVVAQSTEPLALTHVSQAGRSKILVRDNSMSS